MANGYHLNAKEIGSIRQISANGLSESPASVVCIQNKQNLMRIFHIGRLYHAFFVIDIIYA